jgi:hypothetical protein
VWGLDDDAVVSFARAGTLADGMSERTRQRIRDGVEEWLRRGSES